MKTLNIINQQDYRSMISVQHKKIYSHTHNIEVYVIQCKQTQIHYTIKYCAPCTKEDNSLMIQYNAHLKKYHNVYEICIIFVTHRCPTMKLILYIENIHAILIDSWYTEKTIYHFGDPQLSKTLWRLIWRTWRTGQPGDQETTLRRSLEKS